MRYKKIMMLAIFLVSLLAISAVSAAENVTDDIVGIDNQDDNVLNVNPKTFTDLNNAINGNTKSDVYLYSDYTYNPDLDSDFIKGISIGHAVTIHGNGHTIDGAKTAGIFTSSGSNVVFKDIIFVNGKATKGGAINVNNCECSVVNCIFTDNAGGVFGGAIYVGESPCSIVNCTFSGNHVPDSGGAIYCSYGPVSAVDCTFIENYCESGNGGAMYYGYAENCVFIENSALYGGAIYRGEAESCIFNNNYGNKGPNTYNSHVLKPILNVSNLASSYKTGDMFVVDFTNSKGVPITNAEVTIEVYKDNSFVGTYKFLSGEGWAVNLDAGSYDAVVRVDPGYIISSVHATINVKAKTPSNLNLDVPDVTKDYAGSEKLEITLTDSGSPIANANVNININGQTYTKTTDSKGKAYLELDLKADNYDVTVTYKDISTAAKVIINKLTTKNSLSYTKNSRNSFTLTASVNPSSASGNVVFTVNGEDYTAKVNAGKATYTLNNLAVGSYDVKSNYNGDANHKASASNSIRFTVAAEGKLGTELTASDVATTYNSGKNLVATLKDADGKAISTANVIVNLNNVDYTLKTDSQGKVRLSTDGLAPDTYIATIAYDGNSEYNPSSAIVNVVVEKADTSLQATVNNNELVATLTNGNTGKAISSANVKFNINGVKTTVKTNSKGQAKISTEDIPTGSTVKISYAGNSKYRSASTSVVLGDKTDIIISADYDVSNNQVVATLTNAATGKAVANANVKVIMNGATATVKTNTKGQAEVSTAALPLGTYAAVISYAGNSKYNPASTSISFDVKTKVIITDIYGNSSELRARLTNGATGSPIANANMDIRVFYYKSDYDHWLSAVIKNAKSDSKGQISLPNMLLGGEYSNEVIISYAGNSRYTPSNATAIIDINKANMMITYSYNANKQILTATLKNSKTGKAVSNANMVVDVGGVQTTLKSNSNGQIKFSTADFAPGTYVGTVSYGGNAKYNPISAAFKAVV